MIAASPLLATLDWSRHPLGEPGNWSPELRAAVLTVLASERPMLLWWGPELYQLYNEPYGAIIGDKHPGALGEPAAAVWAEVWDELGFMAEGVITSGQAASGTDMPLLLSRHDYLEETYWTFSYSPIFNDDGAVIGIFVATTDMTAVVVSDRRLRAVRDLGMLARADRRGESAAAVAAAEVLSRDRVLVPFSLVLECTDDGLRVMAHHGLRGELTSEPVPHASVPPAAEAIRTRQAQLVDLAQLAGLASPSEPAGLQAVPSPLGERVLPTRAMVFPIVPPGADEVIAVLCVGISPYRAMDSRYDAFLGMIEHNFAVILADSFAYQQERLRAQALVDLDALKTTFFQNVSHEFRTPLSLMLGPLQALLDDPGALPAQADRERVTIALRSARRLRRLVDSLLTFARADAARLELRPVAVQVDRLTREIAAMFASQADTLGLGYDVDIPDLPVVRLDPALWSDIVLNLLSNALKFTSTGAVTLAVAHDGVALNLTVTDTGIGIDPDEQQLVFERFHQSRNGISHGAEGAGIGLSLVADLVESVSGAVTLDSEIGRGSRFTVRIPAPPVVSAAADVPVAVISDGTSAALLDLPAPRQRRAQQVADPEVARGTVLLIEDDPDMREYVAGVLRADGWRVTAAADVMTALSAAVTPDIVVSDVMMPGTDGIELVRMLRQEPALARIPVILLSARAGSEATAKGLRAGADDYITKPFEVEELLARVQTHVELAALRDFALKQAEQQTASLQVALQSNRQIGTAIGILMTLQRVTADQAFDLLRQTSQNQHRKLRDVAEEVTLTGALPER